jgi:hypothetical protein
VIKRPAILQRKNEMTTEASPPPAPKHENLLANLALNVAIPALVMAQLSKEHLLGPRWGLVTALAFPLGYGIYDFIARRKTNFISVLGFVGVLLNGTFGLLALDGFWFAVKDAALPSVIGCVLLASMGAREPVIKALLVNDTVMDVARVESALRERSAEPEFAGLLRQCTVLLALAMFVSGAIGYFLARHLLRSPGGTPEFNAELAKMHWLAVPVIMVPSMIMMMVVFWKLMGGLTRITGLTTDEIFRAEKK